MKKVVAAELLKLAKELVAEKVKKGELRKPYYALSDGFETFKAAVEDLPKEDKTRGKLLKSLDKIESEQSAIHRALNEAYIWD